MPNLFDPGNLYHLDNPERRKLIPPYDTLVEMGLSAGQVFVDIGAGAGYFSIPATAITGPSGRVIAIDRSQEMLDHLKTRAEEAGSTIVTLLSPPDAVPLPDNTADMTFMAIVFHEIDERVKYLKELKRITRPDGILVVIDWAKIKSHTGPPIDHRVGLREAIHNITAAGFNVKSNGMLNPYQYFVTARPS
jgi:ubiquinone/menaquinone biosynthesis C-methylase UbiE